MRDFHASSLNRRSRIITAMPRTLNPDKYPDEFHILLDRAMLGPVTIPSPSGGAGLRGYIQACFRACEAAGGPRAEKAQALQVTSTPTEVTICRRSEGKYARLVTAALGASVSSDADSMAKRLAEKFLI